MNLLFDFYLSEDNQNLNRTMCTKNQRLLNVGCLGWTRHEYSIVISSLFGAGVGFMHVVDKLTLV